jgi:hypothetical protein
VQGLIPETVQRIDYRKGPYRADTGDFSFVGASFITTYDEMEPFALAEVGEYGYRRFVAGGSVKVGGGRGSCPRTSTRSRVCSSTRCRWAWAISRPR